MIVEWSFSLISPDVSEETDTPMKSAHGVGSHYGHSFSSIKTKVFLEKISCHFSISDSIGMRLVFGGFVRLISKLWAIFSASFELNGSWKVGLKGGSCSEPADFPTIINPKIAKISIWAENISDFGIFCELFGQLWQENWVALNNSAGFFLSL